MVMVIVTLMVMAMVMVTVMVMEMEMVMPWVKVTGTVKCHFVTTTGRLKKEMEEEEEARNTLTE